MSRDLSLAIAIPESEATHRRLSSKCKIQSVGFGANCLGRMQLTPSRGPPNTSRTLRLVIECDPGPAKTRRAPSRLCRDARSMVERLWHV